jgi:hypothetical protein
VVRLGPAAILNRLDVGGHNGKDEVPPGNWWAHFERVLHGVTSGIEVNGLKGKL